MADDILLQVMKPARYIGGEWNISRKVFDRAEIKFALCFPDLYEVGMSNLGIRIIYGILNNIPAVTCERFFSVAADMENILRAHNTQISSLESKRPLKEFDIIGFSLGSELGYTNVLNILELGSIPLSSSLRDHTYPLVIAGGPCALNPEPLHEFFDLFLVGEAEEAILEIIEIYKKHKDKFKEGIINKEELLFLFAQIEGVYVPSLYEVRYSAEGQIEDFLAKVKGVQLKIRKRFVKDLNSSFFPSDWLVPYIQVVHDRLSLEIMRGCPNRCRFCQARSQHFPFRYRRPQDVLRLASELYNSSGYEEISLSGLSISDYPQIETLLENLVDLFKPRSVGISLPSVKPKTMLGNLSSLIATIKKTGLTFAPETGSERLRRLLAKDFDEEEFFRALGQAYSSGYQHVKLYFLIGLPQESDEDLDAIIDFSLRVSQLRRKFNNAPAAVNISINPLIPKPHTPFQWLGMSSMDYLKHSTDYLRDKVKNKRRLNLSFHNRYMSFLEGVLSRGDRSLSRVILAAFKRGARFDAWADHFSFDKWMAAFQETGIDPDFYLRNRPTEETLPWDFIDVGIPKEVLIQEYAKINEDITYGTMSQEGK